MNCTRSQVVKCPMLPSSTAAFVRGRYVWRLHPRLNSFYRQVTSSGPNAALDLVGWVTDKGGYVSPDVTIERDLGEESGGGFGLRAIRDVKAGSQLICLPAAAHLTYDADSDPQLLELINQVPEELWGAKLALQVLAHRVLSDSSPYNTYIENLPVGVPGIPAFFSGDEVAALQYPPVCEQVKKRCRWMIQFSSTTLQSPPDKSLHPFAGVTVDANVMGWALAVVTSRAFRTRGPSHPAAMLPLVDMANHSFHPNCEVLPWKGEGVTMQAKCDIEGGQPLMLSYGKLSNDFLLMDYGFVVDDNPYDDIKLRFDLTLLEMGAAVSGLNLDLKPSPWQLQILHQLRLLGDGANTEVVLSRSTVVDFRLVAAVRVLLANDSAEIRGRGIETLGQWAAELNVKNEVLTLRTLVGICAVVLSQFPTNLEQDVHLFTGGPMADNMKLAMRFRMEKKKLLVNAMREMGDRLKALTGGSPAVPSSSSTTQSSNTGRTTNSNTNRTNAKSKAKTKIQKVTSKGFG